MTLSPWQAAVVYGVIVPGPVITLVLLARHPTLANVILAMSMTIGLVFGGLLHYVVVSPDNIAHLPARRDGELFRGSAAALTVVEGIGVLVAVVQLRNARPSS